MTITLVEKNAGGAQKGELSFNKPKVLVGRDAGECDIDFDKAKYPMVSRRHAEFRLENGKWLLADLNSSYGVFVNAQRVSSPQEITAGSSIQFGTDGPTLIVIWFDAESASDIKAAAPPPVATPQPQTPRIQAVPPPPNQPQLQRHPDPIPQRQAVQPRGVQTASLEFVGTEAAKPFVINASSIWIGRGEDCSIVIESSAGMVSRRHAEIRLENGEFVLEDNKSFNGTLVNEQRIAAPTPIYHDDRIQLGVGGPVLRFNSPGRIAPKGASLSGQRAVAASQTGNFGEISQQIGSKTMVFNPGALPNPIRTKSSAAPQLLMSVAFGDKNSLTIGRDDKCDIRLDGLQISNRHARIFQSGTGVVVEDLKSTNGVFINGKRISRQVIQPNDAMQIGAFLIGVDAADNVNVFDTRSKTRIDAVNITKHVRDGASGGKLVLLDSISLSIRPNEFVGILGPSGAGKSMLMDVMNGIRPASGGHVLVNNLDLHRHLDSLKQSIGYVPQDDIIHRELTVYRTLYYVAKLRLSRDVSAAEIGQIVSEVLDVTGLAERRNVPINQLSGGQRKRVSIAVELITKPSIIFLDEPTSGLDPAAEERIMKLFRQIAESGRTVILTTHAMENVKLFDKIVVLMGGKLVFYGKPAEALTHLKAANFKELYDRLEQPVEKAVREHGESHRRQITEQTADEWKKKFIATPQYQDNVQRPQSELGTHEQTAAQKKRRLGIIGALSQWLTLSRRYIEVLLKDKLTLFILFAQAPIIALMTYFVMGADEPRDFVYFVLALVSVWFGISVSAREIVRERPVYERERMVNLGLLPYLASKLFVLGIIVSLQCLMLFVPLKLFDLLGLIPMPGEHFGIPQFWTMLLTAGVGIGVGLFISALVRTSEMATSLVPLILIPQILFSGLVGVPNGITNKVVSMTMPAAWSFDTMKRFSTLDTLEPEGASMKGKTKGLGLYKYVESENEKTVAKAKEDFEQYKRESEGRYQDDPASSQMTPETTPEVTIKKVPDDLSGYVTFLHP
ncbi:MAG: FHA domain-containing protein [Pyrinomonadaceae bacterium]